MAGVHPRPKGGQSKLRDRHSYREPSEVTTRYECPHCSGPHPAKGCPGCPECGSRLVNGLCTRGACTRTAALGGGRRTVSTPNSERQAQNLASARTLAEARYGELLGPAKRGGEREQVSAPNLPGAERVQRHVARQVHKVAQELPEVFE